MVRTVLQQNLVSGDINYCDLTVVKLVYLECLSFINLEDLAILYTGNFSNSAVTNFYVEHTIY